MEHCWDDAGKFAITKNIKQKRIPAKGPFETQFVRNSKWNCDSLKGKCQIKVSFIKWGYCFDNWNVAIRNVMQIFKIVGLIPGPMDWLRRGNVLSRERAWSLNLSLCIDIPENLRSTLLPSWRERAQGTTRDHRSHRLTISNSSSGTLVVFD